MPPFLTEKAGHFFLPLSNNGHFSAEFKTLKLEDSLLLDLNQEPPVVKLVLMRLYFLLLLLGRWKLIRGGELQGSKVQKSVRKSGNENKKWNWKDFPDIKDIACIEVQWMNLTWKLHCYLIEESFYFRRPLRGSEGILSKGHFDKSFRHYCFFIYLQNFRLSFDSTRCNSIISQKKLKIFSSAQNVKLFIYLKEIEERNATKYLSGYLNYLCYLEHNI